MRINREQLPDQLCDGLKVVFVGTAAGRHSAETRAYYAHPGNRFWRTLHEVGLTPNSSHMSIETYWNSGSASQTLQRWCRAWITRSIHPSLNRELFGTFTSKRAASLWLVQRTGQIGLGRQHKRPDFPETFVLSSPSGAATRYWNLDSWRELANWLRSANS